MDIMMMMGFLTRSDINWAVQPQRVVRGLNFWIEAVEGLYNLCSKWTKALISCAVTICKKACSFMKQLQVYFCNIDSSEYMYQTLLSNCPAQPDI